MWLIYLLSLQTLFPFLLLPILLNECRIHGYSRNNLTMPDLIGAYFQLIAVLAVIAVSFYIGVNSLLILYV